MFKIRENDDYIINNRCITIFGYSLFNKLKKFFSLKISGCCYSDDNIYLFCDFPKEKIIEIKKFFYDNYPCSKYIETTNYGIKIYFTMNVKIEHKPISLLLN